MTVRTGPQHRSADITSIDLEKRTVEMTWTTGARVLRSSWFDGPFFEELSLEPGHVRMGRLESGTAPFLANHDTYDVTRVMGVVEAARLENGKGWAKVRFAKAEDDPEADKVFRKIADKIVRNVSVGYRIYKTEKIEGVENKIPTLRAIDWEPHELSAVPVGADAGAGFRSVETRENDLEIVNRFTHKEMPSMNEQEKRAADEAAKKTEQAAAKKREDEIAAQAAQAERERISGIESACRVAKLPPEFARGLVDKATPLDEARKLVLAEMAKRSDDAGISGIGAPIEIGETDREKWVRGATLGLLARTGQLPLVLAAAAGVKSGKITAPGLRAALKDFDPEDEGGAFRGYSLLDFAAESLERQGVKVRGLDKERMVAQAFVYGRSGPGMATTSDFAVLLENVMYKTLLGAYAQASDTWRRFVGTDSVQDFRPANRYRLGSFGSLDHLTEHGEFKSKAIPDGLKFSITTETRGNKIAVSRQSIINDDMGAITDMIGKFGRAAGLSIEKDVYALLAENGGLGPNVTIGGVTAPLFDGTAWGNVGDGNAISMAALEAERVLMASQKDPSSNEYLALSPSVLLVPEALRGEAVTINSAKYDPTANSAFERPNIVNGLFRDIVSTPRLTGTRRYIFCDPSQAAAILCVFLNGAQAPFMDQMLGWNVDGTEVKLRHDFKVQAFDPKGAVTDAGT